MPNVAGTVPASSTRRVSKVGRGRRQRPPDHPPGAIDHRRRGPTQRAVHLRLQRGRRGVRPQAALGATHARDPVGLDDDVTDLAGVAAAPEQQAPVAHHAGLDGVGQQQHHHVGGVARRADPPLGDHPRLRRRGHLRRHAGELGDAIPELEAGEPRHVQRHHRAGRPVERPLARDPAREQTAGGIGAGRHDAAHEALERRPHIALGRGDPVAHHHLALGVHHSGGESIVTDVDRQEHRLAPYRPTVRARELPAPLPYGE